MTDIYQEQRIRGSIEIIDFAKQIADENDINIDKYEWDNGQDINDTSINVFSVFSGGDNLSIEISDEVLADYPGLVGTEEANTKIRKLILSFI